MIEIYTLAESDGRVRYVGQSICAKKRFSWHKSAARRGEAGRVYNWLRAMNARGEEPVMLVVETCLEKLSDDREAHWIRSFQEAGSDLVNCTAGGGGTRGRQHSEKAKMAIGAAHRGKRVSTETRAKLSAGRKGKPLSEKHRLAAIAALRSGQWTDDRRRAISDRMRGNKHCLGVKRSDETKAKMRASVRQGERGYRAAVSNAQAAEIRALVSSGQRQIDVASRLGLSSVTVHRIVANKTYRELEP